MIRYCSITEESEHFLHSRVGLETFVALCECTRNSLSSNTEVWTNRRQIGETDPEASRIAAQLMHMYSQIFSECVFCVCPNQTLARTWEEDTVDRHEPTVRLDLHPRYP